MSRRHDPLHHGLPPALCHLHLILSSLLFCVVFLAITGSAQPRHLDPARVHLPARVLVADDSDCPDCTAGDITFFSEVMTKYQGMKGTNPSAPSTYNLIGKHKFSGSGWDFTNSFFGENWYTIRTEKQILTGVIHDFGVSNYGDESDWNIHVLPDEGFEDFVSDAILYRADNWYGSADWKVTADGKVLIEDEITPDEHRYGNPWFNNNDGKTILLNKRLSAYGPFVREEAHGYHPEIHPCEQLWWTEGDDVLMILLLNDDSNRFKRRADTTLVSGSNPVFLSGDFSSRRATTLSYVPWVQEKGQEAELQIAFEIDPSKEVMHMSVQAVDDLNFYAGAAYPDASEGDKSTVMYKGNPVLTVQESAPIDPFVGVTFRNVCFNRARGMLQGYVILNTAIGNGNGKEGFVALRIDKTRAGKNSRPTIFTGDLLDRWKLYGAYDDGVAFSDIISSDMNGKGIVNGLIDFNGNGKTDLFAKKGDQWLVLYDGKGSWQQLNTSSIPVNELRFGDVDGDKKTDILRVGPGKKVMVSFGGTGQWTEVTDAGTSSFQVGDFNGDGKTDIVYMKYELYPNQFPPKIWRGTMFVKYGVKGSWKVLNKNYQLHEVADDYVKNFRFGNFNGDKITDIFRYNKGRFGVYYNGTGDFKELCKPGFDLKTDDLLFVDHMTTAGFTDVVYVNPVTKKWTVFYGGKPGSLPLSIKHADPAAVRFGDLDADPAVEPFAIEFADQPISPLDIPMVAVQKATFEPSVRPRYASGSLKRIQTGGKPALTVSMNVNYYPGSGNARRSRSDLRNITGVTERIGSKALRFKPSTVRETPQDEVAILGTIEDVPLSGVVENHIQIRYAARSVPESFGIPAYAITGVADGITEIIGSDGNWASWKDFLAHDAKPEKASLLSSPPGDTKQVKTVSFELLPLYSSLEEGQISLAEMDDVTKEMNDIAYGKNTERKQEIFGGDGVFSISWQFELKNLSNGRTMTINNPASLQKNGRWTKSKILYSFPIESGLLQFKAIATINDGFGNSSVKPLEFVFWNQRVNLTSPEQQLSAWLAPVRDRVAGDFGRLLGRAKFLAEDNIMTPDEVGSIVR